MKNSGRATKLEHPIVLGASSFLPISCHATRKLEHPTAWEGLKFRATLQKNLSTQLLRGGSILQPRYKKI